VYLLQVLVRKTTLYLIFIMKMKAKKKPISDGFETEIPEGVSGCSGALAVPQMPCVIWAKSVSSSFPAVLCLLLG